MKMNGGNEKVKFLLNWNHFSDHISSCMARLMTDSSYSDVIIATGDKRMIYAHRFVLANSSKYFQRLLRQMNKQRGVQLVVALPEVKYEILKILMNYMYRGESQVPHKLLPSVLKTGRILEINGLVDLHDADETEKGASIWKFRKGEQQSNRSLINSPKAKVVDNKKNEVGQIVQDKTIPREITCLSDGKRKTKCQNIDIDSTSELSATNKNGMIRRFRPILPKNEGSSRKREVNLPMKRKAAGKDIEKEAPSSSTENPVLKKSTITEEVPIVSIKREKLDENSWDAGNQSGEEITIKTELPFESDEINYNELLCDFCNESYSNPSDWVRHMTDHHGDRGYQTYKDMEKEGRSENVYTCVICSTVLSSAAEWARHLRVWHTDVELAKANKIMNRSKKESESRDSSNKN